MHSLQLLVMWALYLKLEIFKSKYKEENGQLYMENKVR